MLDPHTLEPACSFIFSCSSLRHPAPHPPHQTTPPTARYAHFNIYTTHACAHTNARVKHQQQHITRHGRLPLRRKQRDLFSQSAPASSRTSTNRTPRTRDAVAAAPCASVIEPGVGKRWARDAERKLFWYQDAIHEQELQSQLLEQKVNSLQGQVGEILEERRRTAGLPGFGVLQMEKEMRRREQRELASLAKNLQASEALGS